MSHFLERTRLNPEPQTLLHLWRSVPQPVTLQVLLRIQDRDNFY